MYTFVTIPFNHYQQYLTMDINQYTDEAIKLTMHYAPNLLLAIATLIVGIIMINTIVKFERKLLIKREIDESLVPFLVSLTNILLKAMLLISVASMVGIQTTSFVAVLGAAGLAIGLALQGSLANFAGGVLILLFKPFKVGDVIEAEGITAAVHAIRIFHTELKTYDNKTIIMPNGPLSNGTITNFSTEPTRKVEWIFGIGYEDDIDKAREVIKETIYSDPRVLDKDEPFIHISELGDSSVNFKVRALVKGEDYWDVLFDMTEHVKKAFDKAGISIPYPQSDVHLHTKIPSLLS